MSPAPKGYRPGSKYGQFRSPSRLGKNRIAWSKTFFGLLALYQWPEEDVKAGLTEVSTGQNEPGDSFSLLIERPGRKPLWLNLTAMTEPELDTIRDIIQLSLDEAYPIVRERDRQARDAESAGDDSFTRIYRDVPQFVVRKRPERQDREGVLDGPEDVLEGDGGGGSPDDGDEVGGNLLAESVQEGSGTEDDEPPSDEPSDVLDLGGKSWPV